MAMAERRPVGRGVLRGQAMNSLAAPLAGSWDVVQAGNAATGSGWTGGVVVSNSTSQATYASASDVLTK